MTKMEKKLEHNCLSIDVLGKEEKTIILRWKVIGNNFKSFLYV